MIYKLHWTLARSEFFLNPGMSRNNLLIIETRKHIITSHAMNQERLIIKYLFGTGHKIFNFKDLQLRNSIEKKKVYKIYSLSLSFFSLLLLFFNRVMQ